MRQVRIWAAVIAIALVAACAPPPPQTVNGVRIIGANETDSVLATHLDQLNAFRASRGLSQVALSPALVAAAQTHARDMSVQERAWHFGSDGTSPADRAARAGYSGRLLGENISESYDEELAVFQSWVNDPVSRRVMLVAGADDLGVGWYQEADGKLWWVQVLGDGDAAPNTPAMPEAPGA